MGFRQKTLPLFVDPHSTIEIEKDARFDIILSPSFYWVKRVSIPVKHSRDVKKFLPSLFEDTVPPGDYSYYAYKDEENYIIFAYDDKMILSTLKAIGFSSEQINRVYFAQSEFQEITQAISLDDACILDVEEHIVVKLPKNFSHTAQPMALEQHQFTGHAITLSQYSHIATTKSLVTFSVFMGTLIGIFALDWIVSDAKITEFEEAPLALYEKYDLAPTKIQNEVMLSNLHNKYAKQMRLREITHILLSLKLNKDEYISLYDLQEKRLVVEFQLASSQRVPTLRKTILKHGLTPKENVKKALMRLEFVL